MPIPEWQDRRGMFQRGREVADPSQSSLRRGSTGSTSIAEAMGLSKTNTNQSAGGAAAGAATGSASSAAASPTVDHNPGWGEMNRRRSSAASGSTGMFANLTHHKRGSEDYSSRRSSHAEMEGKQGILGGIWNSTFRGMQRTKEGTEQAAKEAKKGIME